MASSNRANGLSLVPPLNFATVEEGVFRSAYPTEANVPYLRHIGIRNVVLLSIETLPGPVKRSLGAEVAGKAATGYATRGPIRVIDVADMCTWRVDGMNSGDDFSRRDVVRALDFAVDRHWHPVLFACPLGELQTSVLVGCMRRYQHWSLASIFSECELFTRVCRNLRSSLLFLIESWDPVVFPISAVNIQYRNREMHLRDRTRATEERRRHRRATAAASLAKNQKPNLSDSVQDGDGGEDDEEEEGDNEDDVVDEVHSGVSDLVDRSAVTDPRLSSVTTSPHKARSEASETRTPPMVELRTSNQAAAFISTSGQRPPMTMRRAAAQRLRDQQQQQQPIPPYDPLKRGGDPEGVDFDSLHVERDTGVMLAEWYLEALRVGEELRQHTMRSSIVGKPSVLSPFGENLPPPHLRYADVRNPPALDSRSKFTKESIVEEDDD
ncbi:hypothetical protein ABB37_01147 [Leptomonas pyrrhocoris]|uniref:Tyrosine phosphatase n=1 Tax=Leptomonas pyrrhocoris TaxID=157538 RepID=A0A0N0DYW6_LEPPY|nr:hypothetical protein ABB37_01147 [Leptomonas pyrrhocoris]KPA84625.1 hypothetical protein ABB37_01147 [Leptomonas pyrrhocoris]|eukprot:XP_015663064.1 hypothetical protein ABB37_01147 [Leptomonas pyrrhocoris]